MSASVDTRRTSGLRLSIGMRLGATFGAVLGLFAVALLVVLPAMSRLDEADRDVARVDRAKTMGHRVAALVREQYIHQAHTIIEWNRSHVAHYADVAATTRRASHDLAAHAKSPDETALATEIAALVRKNDEDFVAVTLPAIDRDERDEVTRLHAETELVVGRVATLAAALNGRFEARSEDARARADKERKRVRASLLGCFGAATLLAAVASVFTTRRIASRVSVLREGARRLGDGDLSRRVALDGHDELADLARSFDEMARRLEAHQRDLVQSQKLASIGRLCSGVAHEINGPLGIILGYAQVIRTQGVDEEALGAIEEEAKECQRIVQALLDTSRQSTPSFEPVDLGQLADDAVERLRTTGKLAGRAIVVRPSSAVVALGDEGKLRQVVLNLLTNAVEATADGGTIHVEVAERGGLAILAVVDDGPGMTSSTKAHVFEPFFTTKEKGTGLGLAVSRAIVEAHRGEIVLESTGTTGTRAEVRLRKAAEAVEGFA